MLINKKKFVAIVLSVGMLTSLTLVNSMTIFASTSNVHTDYFIENPYAAVNWASFGQYKADFHSHTTESDGGNTAAEMIEDHYAKGFDILALTDHSFTNTAWDRTDRPADKVYLTSQRLAEISSGSDRNGKGMVAVTNSDEQSNADHLNTFWSPFTNQPGATLESNIATADELGGISHINHLGRYTGASSATLEEGQKISTDPAVVGKYVDLFTKYNSVVGMEIVNKKDGDSVSDRILWDSILQQTMQNRRPVWGFSNDDTHSVAATGFSYNMMLMPENNVENIRKSMENGAFYAVAKVAKRELGANFVAKGATPTIKNISVNQDENAITIKGDNYKTIQWIADGKVIATGNKIDLNDYENKVTSYIRAQLIGDGGISFTQPFGINKYTIDNLKQSVEKLDLNNGMNKSLIAKLNKAEKSIDTGKGDYVNYLKEFTNEVKAQSGKKITVDQVKTLTNAVNEIILNLTPQS